MRLDTAQTQRLGYAPDRTTFLWTPYSQQFIVGYLDRFAKRGVSAMTPHPSERPYLLAYLSGDCKPHRDMMFNVFQEASIREEQPFGEVHGLGKCRHTRDWAEGQPYPPSNIYAPFDEYRFVLVMENCDETGYVTEKLGSALYAGAVPIYWVRWCRLRFV